MPYNKVPGRPFSVSTSSPGVFVPPAVADPLQELPPALRASLDTHLMTPAIWSREYIHYQIGWFDSATLFCNGLGYNASAVYFHNIANRYRKSLG